MKVNVSCSNASFLSLIDNPGQVVFLDANFFIPPDRSRYRNVKSYRFDRFKEVWLVPLMTEFSGLSIHESVYDELVTDSCKSFADESAGTDPAKLKIYYDSELDKNERALMIAFIDKISMHSQYDPDRDNSKDRGEVLSLSYMATKGFLFFAANDELPIRLIQNADKLNTGLDNMGIIQMYELIYYLYQTGKYDSKELRRLYKYQYYLTDREKRQNPEWGIFIRKMDELYGNGENTRKLPKNGH